MTATDGALPYGLDQKPASACKQGKPPRRWLHVTVFLTAAVLAVAVLAAAHPTGDLHALLRRAAGHFTSIGGAAGGQTADVAVTAAVSIAATKAQIPDVAMDMQATPVWKVSEPDIGTPGLDEKSQCRLQGAVDECCSCTYPEVDKMNEVLYPTLKKLAQTRFFRYFKVNLWCDCPLWPDNGMCSIRACAVCECEPSELPTPWLVAEGLSKGPTCSTPANSSVEVAEDLCDSALCAAEAEGIVDRVVEPDIVDVLQHVKGWRGLSNPWMTEGEEGEEYSYINLLANPERFTGYKGEDAARIWSAIYSQSCIQQPHDCTEKRVFFRLISGMHTSISAHISAHFLLDEEAGVWGPSSDQFKQRLGTPEVQQHVQNLYFAYLFVLRAVHKAGALLEQFEYNTGDVEDDAHTTQLIKELLARQELPNACPMPFDEGRLWKGAEGPALLEQAQIAFRNITRIMDCVGCEKCRLWGKLQTLGLATALKILFSSPDCSGTAPTSEDKFGRLTLERNEVIALVNLMERFAASLHYYHVMSEQQAEAEPETLGALAGAKTVS